jgi:hypothetical protein
MNTHTNNKHTHALPRRLTQEGMTVVAIVVAALDGLVEEAMVSQVLVGVQNTWRAFTEPRKTGCEGEGLG